MTRGKRIVRLSLVLSYSLLLLVAAWPRLLTPPIDALRWLGFGANILLERVGVAAGLEVWNGISPPADVPHMACFLVRGHGPGGAITLYDDRNLCAGRKVSPIRDPFRIFQHRNLSAALVHLDLGGHRNLRLSPLRELFAFTDYYCHREDARRASVRAVEIVSEFLTLNYRTGELGRHPMGGFRRCDTSRWNVLGHPG